MTSARKTSGRPSNVTELRARIDAGRTGGKTPGVDPAAVATALEDETRQGRARPAPQDSIAPDARPREPHGNFWTALIVAVIALAIVYLILAARR